MSSVSRGWPSNSCKLKLSAMGCRATVDSTGCALKNPLLQVSFSQLSIGIVQHQRKQRPALRHPRNPLIPRRILVLPIPWPLRPVLVPRPRIEIPELLVLHLVHLGVELGADAVRVGVV